jgi:proteasome accessory factor B
MQPYDTLASRLASLLTKLNQGDALRPAELAQEFGVSLRTIQRDIHVRLAHLALEKKNGAYVGSPQQFGMLSLAEVMRFAEKTGLAQLHTDVPRLIRDAVSESGPGATWRIKGSEHEEPRLATRHFEALKLAIKERRLVQMSYAGRTAVGSAVVEPYRLTNMRGIWYLVARSRGRPRTFSLARIGTLSVLDQAFQPDAEFVHRLNTEEGIWITDSPIEVVLHVDATAAPYFRRRKLVPHQKIERDMPEGGLVVRSRVHHVNEIVPVVRYWIPHVAIIEPASMQASLVDELCAYASRYAVPAMDHACAASAVNRPPPGT